MAEELVGGVPGGLVAGCEPAPVAGVSEGEEGGDGESAGDVADAGVGGDDEVEILHDGNRIEKRAAGGVEIVAEVDDGKIGE